MNGVAIIVIILVPIAFQIVMLNIRMDRQHKEVMKSIEEIKEKLSQ